MTSYFTPGLVLPPPSPLCPSLSVQVSSRVLISWTHVLPLLLGTSLYEIWSPHQQQHSPKAQEAEGEPCLITTAMTTARDEKLQQVCVCAGGAPLNRLFERKCACARGWHR